MSTNKIGIWNMALGHLGVAKTVSSEGENSNEARACKRFWETTFETTLRDFALPSTKKIKTLELIEENPTDDWLYSYKYPNDCAFFRRILSGVVNDTPDSRVQFDIILMDAGRVILTNETDAQCEYTVNNISIAYLPSDIVLAMSLRLSVFIAPELARGDSKLRKESMDLYQLVGMRAMASNLNERHIGGEPEDSFTASRS